MDEAGEWLSSHLHGRTAPFLFVGAGLSRRYGNVEDWQGLLRHFAQMTGKPYEYYFTSAEGDLPTIASRIADVFHEVWWTDGRFGQSREQFAGIGLAGRESALKVEVALHLSDAASRLPTDGPLHDELTLLRGATVDGIITTNFDPILPSIFPGFRTFVGQDELLFANPQGIGEIYQIHGSEHRPDSLVLTAADYARFEDRNAYLAAKLLTVFVEHPVLFLGYSLTDRNVVSILRSIGRCLTQDNIDQLRDLLIFVQWDPSSEASFGPYTIMVNDFVLTVQRLVVPDFLNVFGVLTTLKRAFPAKLLRQLKEQVYELILSDDPQERLHVADIDDETNLKDIDIVFGVGAGAGAGLVGNDLQQDLPHRGYVGLTRWDLVEDVLGDGNALDPAAVVNTVLPRVSAGSANTPVFKYLREADVLGADGEIVGADVPRRVTSMAQRIRDGLPASAWHRQKAAEALAGIRGIKHLEEVQGAQAVFNFGNCLAADRVDLEELRAFLVERDRSMLDNWNATQYMKLACYYDWLRYGRTTPPSEG